MTPEEYRQHCFDELAQTQRLLRRLRPESPIRAAMPAAVLDGIAKKIGKTPPDELRHNVYPPLYNFLTHVSAEAVFELDQDVRLVLGRASPNNASGLTQFLRATAGQSREWYGGIFDIWVRAALLRKLRVVEFDVPLPNGRDTDIRLKLGGRWMRLENTVITEDDESRKIWDRFLDDKKVDPKKVRVRPGPYDPPDAKGPSLYYNTLRLYAKVYDKIAKHLDPHKTQCADDCISRGCWESRCVRLLSA